MLNRVQEVIQKLINGWVLVCLLIVMFFSNPFASSIGCRFTSNVTGPIINVDWSYTVEDITYDISMYQKHFKNEGLQIYSNHQMIADLIYPIFSTLLYFFFQCLYYFQVI